MTSSSPLSKEVVAVAFVLVVVVVMVISSPDSDVCNLRPMFNSREQSATFLAKPFWDKEDTVAGEEETVFIRRSSCPVRVRGREVDEDEAKAGVYSQSLRNGSEKDSSEKKHGGVAGQRKLKGSKRKRKQEKRKRFRKKKQKKS